ncbi:anti-sigma factor [Actinoplanes sp. NPDC049681]|uniref:anti-sigma factor n=1 Tax=Actinoplanes sp. NPDC049681 TaxID=3363905 RepID=UPI0037A43950
MQHLDPDRLVLLALSEDAADPDESVHLAGCGGCRDELRALHHVAELGVEAGDLRALPPPPEHVWAGIQSDIAAMAPVAGPRPAAVVPMGRRSARRRPRWVAPLVSAVAAAVVAIAGTAVAMGAFDRSPDADVTARATLSPLPSAPAGASGKVRVLSDGEMVVDVRHLPLTTGFHEVWLIDPDDQKKMISLGSLSGRPEVVLPVPPGTDLNRYRLVDVSDEAHDGDAAHSGKSLLRGTLTY